MWTLWFTRLMNIIIAGYPDDGVGIEYGEMSLLQDYFIHLNTYEGYEATHDPNTWPVIWHAEIYLDILKEAWLERNWREDALDYYYATRGL